MHLNRLGRQFGVAAFAFILSCSAGCLVRTRTVVPTGKPANKPLLTAEKQELLDRIHRLYDPVQSFSLKVDMSPTVGGVFGGKVTDYPTIHSFIFFRRKDQIRVIGLDPVVHSTILDMLSLGNDFRVSIPTKSLFIEGSNDAPATSKNKLENLRPIAFLNALLIEPAQPDEAVMLEDDSDETMAVYELMFVQHNNDDLRLRRSIYFDRYTLDIVRQRTFDAAGHVASETKYSNWQMHGAARFPTVIDMARPQDGYALQMTITEFKLNPPDVTDDKFVLDPPPNATIKNLSR